MTTQTSLCLIGLAYAVGLLTGTVVMMVMS